MDYFREHNVRPALEAWNKAEHAPYRTIEVKPLSPTIGAEVRGVDIARDIDPGQFDEICRAVREHLVLVFHDQDVTPAEHKRFAMRFGKLHQHVLAPLFSGGKGDPDVLAWKADKATTNVTGDMWHQDATSDKEPIWGSFLRVTRLPESGGGDTMFANMYLAYDVLSDPFKSFIDGLTAIHDGTQAYGLGYGLKMEDSQSLPIAEHPIVVRHPHSGRKFLFINDGSITYIPQLTRYESDAILNCLYRHVERSVAFQVRVHWKPNMLVFWDNWAAQHRAVWDYYPFERWGERVSVTSSQPFHA